MRQYGIISGTEYNPEGWEVAKRRSPCLIITPNDAEFEKTKRQEQRD